MPDVVLTRPGLAAILAHDGQSVTVVDTDPDAGAPGMRHGWADMLGELRRCGLPHGVDVIDEWWEDGPTGPLVVTRFA